MNHARRKFLAALLLCAAVAGCSSSAPPTPTASSPTATAPSTELRVRRIVLVDETGRQVGYLEGTHGSATFRLGAEQSPHVLVTADPYSAYVGASGSKEANAWISATTGGTAPPGAIVAASHGEFRAALDAALGDPRVVLDGDGLRGRTIRLSGDEVGTGPAPGMPADASTTTKPAPADDHGGAKMRECNALVDQIKQTMAQLKRGEISPAAAREKVAELSDRLAAIAPPHFERAPSPPLHDREFDPIEDLER